MKKKKKKKPRKMFRLRLSQEVQVELICPQAKINFRLFPPPARPRRALLPFFFRSTQHQGFIFFARSHAVYEGPVGKRGKRRLGLDILYQRVATRRLIVGHNIPHWLPD